MLFLQQLVLKSDIAQIENLTLSAEEFDTIIPENLYVRFHV